MTMGRGLINLLTHGYSSYGLIDSLAELTKVKILGLPPSFVFMLLIFIATDLLLRYWRPGRQLYYIGGSPESARLIGIRVDRARILTFVVSGTLAAMGGLLFAARTGAASGQAGIGLELLALTAAFVGGVGFGGEGTALGTFLGATLIALIINAMLLLGIPGLWQNIVIGIFLLVAALIGMTRMRRASAYHRVRR
jgi:ribose transport system permease protein